MSKKLSKNQREFLHWLFQFDGSIHYQSYNWDLLNRVLISNKYEISDSEDLNDLRTSRIQLYLNSKKT